MRGLLGFSLLTTTWILVSIFLIFGLSGLFSRISETKDLNTLLISESKNIFNNPGEIISAPREIISAVKAQDARPVLIDNFLIKNNSPMAGTGKVFVQASDKYNIDWRLLPAIAFQESTLGKKLSGSYNPFGWGAVDGTNFSVQFESWGDAIFTVSKGIRENYINNGLTSVESINSVYASDKDWSFGVNFAMDEISN